MIDPYAENDDAPMAPGRPAARQSRRSPNPPACGTCGADLPDDEAVRLDKVAHIVATYMGGTVLSTQINEHHAMWCSACPTDPEETP